MAIKLRKPTPEFADISKELDPVTFYCGDVIEDKNGALLLEWNDPETGTKLLDENDIRDIEEAARHHLCQVKAGDPIPRNRHYSAEVGLHKLQKAKAQKGIALQSRPHYIDTAASALCPSRDDAPDLKAPVRTLRVN